MSSDEKSFISSSFQVPHPPGYPIYIILGKIFQVLFQFSDPAWAVGLLSALTGGAAASLLCMIVYRYETKNLKRPLNKSWLCFSLNVFKCF